MNLKSSQKNLAKLKKVHGIFWMKNRKKFTKKSAKTVKRSRIWKKGHEVWNKIHEVGKVDGFLKSSSIWKK